MINNLNNRLEYYKLLKQLKEAELSVMWEEITEKDYWRWLEVVMPVRMKFNAFLGGDPITDSAEGTLYTAVCMVAGRFFKRPACLEFFNPAKYTTEITAMFEIQRGTL